MANKGDRALPTLTAIMLTFSTVIRTYWWLLAGLGFAAITTLSWLYRQETRAARWTPGFCAFLWLAV